MGRMECEAWEEREGGETWVGEQHSTMILYVSQLSGTYEATSLFVAAKKRKKGKRNKEEIRRTKAGMPACLHPSISSALPWKFDVMKTTSALKLLYASFTSFSVSGLPPLCLESQRVIRSGSMPFLISPEIVGPNVFSWSEPIQMRYQSLLCRHVERAAPSPVPVHTRIPRL